MKTLHLTIIAIAIVSAGTILMISVYEQPKTENQSKPSQQDYSSVCTVFTPQVPISYRFLISEKVFAGTVSHIDNTTDSEWKVFFTVDKQWKGAMNQKSLMVMASTLQGCGYSIHLGEKYLVYSNGYKLYLNPMWSKAYADAQNDIALLDDPKFQAESKTNDGLYKKLTAARDVLSAMKWDQTSELPLSLVGVDAYSTLVIGIDNTKTSLPIETYEIKLKQILGNIPMKVTFAHVEAQSEGIMSSTNSTRGSK
jgi:hypothetical protein